MTDVSLLGSLLAGLVSFISPCVLPLVPGYISILSGIGMEQLRQGQPPRAGLFASSVAFVIGFSVVFISFGASASAVGTFLRENRSFLAPIADGAGGGAEGNEDYGKRSEEHTSELQSLRHLVCRLLLENKKHTRTEP